MSKKEDTITLDIEKLITPVCIFLSVLVFSISFAYGMRQIGQGLENYGGGKTTTSTRTVGETADPVAADPASGLTVADLADAIGLDGASILACAEAETYAEDITNDIAGGTASGVSGTPGFIIGQLQGDGSVINGYRVSGALPFSTFQNIVNGIKNSDQSLLDAEMTTYPDYIFANASTSIDDDPVLGDSNAPIAIVEFSDLECPFCQRHHNDVYPQIVSQLVETGDSAYVFRDFPLSFHEPVASASANAANCVYNEAGAEAYYQFLDLYFENTASNGQGL